MHKAVVSASETYNTALERHLVDALACGSPSARTRMPASGRCARSCLYPELSTRFSKRRLSVEDRRKVLAAAFQATHGRRLTPVETRAPLLRRFGALADSMVSGRKLSGTCHV